MHTVKVFHEDQLNVFPRDYIESYEIDDADYYKTVSCFITEGPDRIILEMDGVNKFHNKMSLTGLSFDSSCFYCLNSGITKTLSENKIDYFYHYQSLYADVIGIGLYSKVECVKKSGDIYEIIVDTENAFLE